MSSVWRWFPNTATDGFLSIGCVCISEEIFACSAWTNTTGFTRFLPRTPAGGAHRGAQSLATAAAPPGHSTCCRRERRASPCRLLVTRRTDAHARGPGQQDGERTRGGGTARHGGGARSGRREPPAVAKGDGRRAAGRGQQAAGHGAAGGRQGAVGNGRAPRPSEPPPRDASASVRTRERGGLGRPVSPRARWREGERPGRQVPRAQESVPQGAGRGRERCTARFAWPALRPLRLPASREGRLRGGAGGNAGLSFGPRGRRVSVRAPRGGPAPPGAVPPRDARGPRRGSAPPRGGTGGNSAGSVPSRRALRAAPACSGPRGAVGPGGGCAALWAGLCRCRPR